MQATQVLNEVRRIAKDQGSLGVQRWDDPALMLALDRAIRAVISVIPGAHAKYTAADLTAGALQTSPSDAVFIISIANTISGALVTETQRKQLDVEVPGWRRGDTAEVPLHWCRLQGDHSKFEVYPPQPAAPSEQVEMYHSYYPSPLGVDPVVDTPLDQRFETALVQHILYQLYTEDSNNPVNAERADKAFEVFRGEVALYAGMEGVN